jgi:hypothetical protein
MESLLSIIGIIKNRSSLEPKVDNKEDREESDNEESCNEELCNEESDNEESDNEESCNEELCNEEICNEESDNEESCNLDIEENKPSEEELFEINTELDLDELGDDFVQQLMLNFFNKPYYKTEKYISCIIDKEILQYCKKWSLNRKLNLLHWNKIYESYKLEVLENSELNIANIISLALYNNNFYIMDGQHRIKALLRLDKEYEFECILRVDLYIVNEHDEMIKILSEINTTNPLDIESLLMGNISSILAYIKSNYANGSKNILTYKKSRRPFINEPKLVEKIKKSKFLISAEIKTVCNLIRKINIGYSWLDADELQFGKKKVTLSMLDKAMEYSCYLGFDSEFNWINKIDKIIEDKFNKKSNKHIKSI